MLKRERCRPHTLMIGVITVPWAKFFANQRQGRLVAPLDMLVKRAEWPGEWSSRRLVHTEKVRLEEPCLLVE
jgi:hypothetical protein